MDKNTKAIKLLIWTIIVGLALSGLTAFPLEWELRVANNLMENYKWDSDLSSWIQTAYQGVVNSNQQYPFMAYGTDWLAFAHLVIAVAFFGPLKDPVKNIWVIEFGLICCIGVFPLALIAGSIRGIPIYWRVFDCAFGLIGGVVLMICYQKIKGLERSKRDIFHVNL